MRSGGALSKGFRWSLGGGGGDEVCDVTSVSTLRLKIEMEI